MKRILTKASSNSLAELASVLFSARNYAHKVHLRTRSYSAHKALEDLYTALLDHADTFVETAQGKYGIMTDVVTSLPMFDTDDDPSREALSFIVKLSTWLETEGRICISEQDTFLHNQLDEVLATVFRAKYKLENLR